MPVAGCEQFALPESAVQSAISSRGFTMVEILTVIGILALLAGIITIAFNVIGNNSATRQTRIALETAQSMMTEYATTATATGAPFDVSYIASSTTGYLYTSRVMQRLMQMPNNVKIYGQLESKLIAPVDWTTGLNYVPGDLITGYSCNTAHTAPATSNVTSNPPWQTSTLTTGMLKDGWGKPIQYVGVSLTSVTRASQTGQTVTSPTGRPFWVSAGPDGDFATHDDNVYSFEN